jgi:ribonucleotide monophosphatase NagD (HAD superfamily)
MGKPSQYFFLMAMRGWNVQKNQVLMIGDDIMTDVKGAQDAGLLGAITCTGKYRQEEIKRRGVTPDVEMKSIEMLPILLEPLIVA